jgi:hypothetical protein
MNTNWKKDQWMNAALIAGGALVVYELFKHRRLVLFGALAAGAWCGISRLVDADDHRHGRPRQFKKLQMGAPSFPGEEVMPSTQEPMDEIDEAAMESFPASDPPASYRRCCAKDQVATDDTTTATQASA